MDIQKLGYLQELFDFLYLFLSAASEHTTEMGDICGSDIRKKKLNQTSQFSYINTNIWKFDWKKCKIVSEIDHSKPKFQ